MEDVTELTQRSLNSKELALKSAPDGLTFDVAQRFDTVWLRLCATRLIGDVLVVASYATGRVIAAFMLEFTHV